MDAWYWLTQSGGLTWVVLIVKVDEITRSILIEQWEDVSRVGPMCAATPAYNLG
jgi:hypothetical protein